MLAAPLAAAQPVPADSGPAAYWPLDEIDAAQTPDKSPAGLTGIVKGKPTVVDGARGRCLRLDGQFDYVTVPDADALDFSGGSFAVTAWVNVYALRGEQQMIVGKNIYKANQREWGLMLDSDNRFRFYLRHDGQWKTVDSPIAPVPGRWVHLAVSVDAGRAALYVNGALKNRADLGQPVPSTEAPLTIGGINDGSRLRQMLYGAVDEVRLYRRVLGEKEVAAMFVPVTATHKIPADSRYTLWEAKGPVPKSADLPLLEGVEFHVIKARQPEKDDYNWLHGVAIVRHKGLLYASFGHNKGSENTASEVANGCTSADGGKTWGPLFTIDEGVEPNLAISAGVFLSHDGCLWAFHGAFHNRMQRVHTRAYLLDERTSRWIAKGVVAEDGFWAMQEPRKMDDGNWLMAGVAVGNGYGGPDDPAAVAISHGDDLIKWDVVRIPKPKAMRMWGESAVIIDGPKILNIARYGKPVALASESGDYGRTWTRVRESNLPMAGSQPYAGVLSNGRPYLVCTTTADSGGRRSPLTIAVGRPGRRQFDKIYSIRDAVHEGPGESGPDIRLSYPYAAEYDGKLYVVYSNDGGRGGNRNSAELAVIPIDKLTD